MGVNKFILMYSFSSSME